MTVRNSVLQHPAAILPLTGDRVPNTAPCTAQANVTIRFETLLLKAFRGSATAPIKVYLMQQPLSPSIIIPRLNETKNTRFRPPFVLTHQ